MRSLRTPIGYARRHRHTFLRGDDGTRPGSRLCLSVLRLETDCCDKRSRNELDTDNSSEAIISVELEIVMTNHEVELHELHRDQVTDRLGHLERYDSRVTRYEVSLDHELNPRQSKMSHRVTITGRGTGPTVHADGCGTDFRAALDGAVGKLEEQLRRRRDRRRVRHDRAHRAAMVTDRT
jgi:ribosomal subunit interface protein